MGQPCSAAKSAGNSGVSSRAVILRNRGATGSVNRFFQLPVIGVLYRRSLLFPVIVLLAVAVILLEGALHRGAAHRDSNEAEFTPPSEPAVSLPALRPDIDKAPLSYASDFWSQLGERARERLMLAGPERATGVTIAPGYALTSLRVVRDLREQERIRAAMGQAPGNAATDSGTGEESPPSSSGGAEKDRIETVRLVGVDLDLGLALVAMDQPYPSRPFPLAEGGLRPGAWIAAVSLTPGGTVEVIPGHLAANPIRDANLPSARRLEAAIPLPETMEISAVIDLDGNLLGVAVLTEKGPQVYSLDAVLASVDRLRAGRPCRAVTVAALGETAARLLKLDHGVLVAKVRDESFAGEPPLRPGDILLLWKGERVFSAEHFEVLYDAARPGQLIPFTVTRANRRLNGRLNMPDANCLAVAPPPTAVASLGLYLDWIESGENAPFWKVAAVAENSPAAESGIAAGDRILAINSQPLTERTRSREFDAFERRPHPLLLTIERAGRAFIVPIVPVPPKN